MQTKRYEGLSFDVDQLLANETRRIATQTRIAHKARMGERDEVAEEVLEKLQELSKFLKTTISDRIKEHPAYPWFSKVRGIGDENIAKVIGLIDAFGRYYRKCSAGHTWKKEEESKKGKCPTCGKQCSEEFFVRGIERLTTPSALFKYSGWGVEKDSFGHWVPMRKKEGEKSAFNTELQTMCWRVGTSLKRATGSYHQFSLKTYDKLKAEALAKGMKVIEVPPGICVSCGAEYEDPSIKKCDCGGGISHIIKTCTCCGATTNKKDTRYCTCGEKMEASKERPGEVWSTHLKKTAFRKMLKLFLAHLWLTWRKAEGLSITTPYSRNLNNLELLTPEQMTDKI